MYELYPARFTNVTNGVTPRRWMVLSNPGLAKLITANIGDRWIGNLEREIKKIEPLSEDAGFLAEWHKVKSDNKSRLAALIKDQTGIVTDPASLFDVQVKRIHEYKRQHLNVLHIIALYNRIKLNPGLDVVPRTFVFGGKAAPGYVMAKLIIKLINTVGAVVNNDPDVAGRLKVVFLPNFNVKNAHHIYPAADLSEQISTAGLEASGTGNMKFSMNGALTIGTLDGANVEIREEVGPENFFLFGLTAGEVCDLKAMGYRPREYYEQDSQLRESLDQIGSGYFSNGDASLFALLVDSLLQQDRFLLLADYQSYIACQDRVSAAYGDRKEWLRMSVLNVARMGKFSSDRSIREYCRNIWNISPIKVQ
jgi:starch phosphorylase